MKYYISKGFRDLLLKYITTNEIINNSNQTNTHYLITE